MSYDYILQKANDLYIHGALNDAEQLYRQILQINPRHPDILNMLGLIAQAKGQQTVAADYFFRAIQNAPKQWIIHFNLAVSLEASGKLHQAAKSYQTALELNPGIKEAYNNLGGLYEKLGQTDLAEQNYKKAIEIDPAYLEPQVNTAALRHNIEQLKALSLAYPQSPLPLYYLALETFDHNLPKADEYISKAISINKNSPLINNLFAKIKLKNKEKDSAVSAFYYTLTLEPDNIEALLNLAILENDEEYFKKVLDLEPQNADAHTCYADYLYANQRTVEALEEYRKAVILNPDLPQVSNNLALILKDLGEYEQSIDLFFNAFIQNSEVPEISQNIAQALTLLQKSKPDRALQIAQKWVKTAPENIWAKQILSFFKGEIGATEQQYNELLFDAFASNYEQTMSHLNYKALDKLVEICPNMKGKILDLGCGTGLAGAALKSADNKITGLDNSQQMLNIAQNKGVYDALIKSDLVDYIQTQKLEYDNIIAVDVFNYLPHPEALFEFFRRIPLFFTLENAPENIADKILMPNGRYQHNALYIKQKLIDAGYQHVRLYPLIIREEENMPVHGTLFAAG